MEKKNSSWYHTLPWVFVIQIFFLSLHSESLNYQGMKQDKLVSVRLSEKTVATLEKYGQDNWGYTRSQLINMGANFISYLIETRQFDKIRRFNPEFGDVVDEFTFKFHRGHK